MSEAAQIASMGITTMIELMQARDEIKRLKEQLAKQEQGEPVAWFWKNVDADGYEWMHVADNQEDADKYLPNKVVPLYTTPQQRTWVGLSVFEINDLVENTEYEDYRDLVERTEAKLKEKNNA